MLWAECLSPLCYTKMSQLHIHPAFPQEIHHVALEAKEDEDVIEVPQGGHALTCALSSHQMRRQSTGSQ